MIGGRDIHPAFFAIADAEGGASAARGRSSPSRLSANPTVVYLAMDQSASLLGWARGSPDMVRPEFGTEYLPAIEAPNGERLIEVRMRAARKFVRDQIRDHGVTHVAIESVYFAEGPERNPVVLEQLYTIKNVIREACFDADIAPCREVAPVAWRKDFLGFANAMGHGNRVARRVFLKDSAMQVCVERGWSVSDEHQAEAIGILIHSLIKDFPDLGAKWLPLFCGSA